ncbi:MAG TPA: MarR family transcriptional regulator [Micrococcales bacterium]|uniref:MarR family transcriptional regulator n=1 Tax=Miniimonas arenae TaxID=676201 RepID=A0A5C5BAA7_9MICO|nr:MarR family transcriptional regulator [Miniimonas arenae]TNU72962.1 MarR family transcriptional regulator [Miniimonas arenae]HCX84507.1 MarR family transcriptional regulator [Micrococcales bacterium]
MSPTSNDLADEVDAITAAWHAQLPTLDVEPMHVFSRLHRLAHHIESMRAATFAQHDLTMWQFDVLAALRRAGEPYELTPGRLVAQTHVSSGTMTNRIDRLAERGLVDRRGSNDDRRIVLVRLTPAGRAAVDAAVSDLVTRERAVLAALDGPGEDGVPHAGELAEALRALLHRYETQTGVARSGRAPVPRTVAAP